MLVRGDLEGEIPGERERDLDRRRGELRIGERRLRSDLDGEGGRRGLHPVSLRLGSALRRGGDSRLAFGGGGGGRSYVPPYFKVKCGSKSQGSTRTISSISFAVAIIVR